MKGQGNRSKVKVTRSKDVSGFLGLMELDGSTKTPAVILMKLHREGDRGSEEKQSIPHHI